ncbi:MAG TPA: phytanoyl-CoA dioxygenase family protein [Longimicrobiaceae bacterium]|nr:phytanoyl-CoA dioxygenase family protein [Longimicrobiaceae bacterium]
MLPMQPTPRLNDPQLEAALEHDGYAVIDGLLSPPEIRRLLDAFETYESPIHRRPFGASIQSDDLEYRAAVDREIKAVLGPKTDTLFNGYRLCFSNILSKAPQATGAPTGAGEVLLHQDISVVDESRAQAIAVWCPLVDTDLVNGCLQVVPGSHRLNAGPHGPGAAFPYRELAPLFPMQAVPMKAGSAMIFCLKLFHASSPNRGTATRVAVGGLFAPRGVPLRCYYRVPGTNRMEVFEVDDLFYTRYIYGTRPQGVPRVAEIDYWYEPLTPERIARLANART